MKSIKKLLLLFLVLCNANYAHIKLEELNTFTLLPTSSSTNCTPYSLSGFIEKLKKNQAPQKAALDIKNKEDKSSKYIWKIKKNIPKINSNYIAIISRGCAANRREGRPQKGGGLFTTYTYIRNDILHVPCICFDYDNSKFNFAQDLDQEHFAFVFNETIKQNPNAQIILIGDCVGALNILKFVAKKQPKQVTTLVLESPFTSAHEISDRIAAQYIKPFFGLYASKILHTLFNWWFTYYDETKDDEFIKSINQIKGKKIFICHRKKDFMISNSSIQWLVNTLQKNNVVSFFQTNDQSHNHSKLTPLPACQSAVNAFYEQNNLPSLNQ